MSFNKNSALILIVANGINLLINFITLPFLSRALSYEDFGTYNQLVLVGSLIQMLFCLGIPSILNVIATQHKEDEKYIFSSANFFDKGSWQLSNCSSLR